uniref:O-phosphoseryl-tRNA(Sec) selenium transferase n=3 Tax=Photinus pyralis TaxID=7054 RepID=A0A1Y1N0T5_PHOPY
MNAEAWCLAAKFVPESYIKQSENACKTRENVIRQLLQHKTLPDIGWDDITIETFLFELSGMDSNNFRGNSGTGEREARFASELVRRRHYYFGHGIGRSGDLTESQPKAAGSSLMYKLTNCLFHDLIKFMGISARCECLVVPVATGMALVLSMLSIRGVLPNAKYVIWSRIDQKSCFKSILSAGFIPIVIDTIKVGDQLQTNLNLLEEKIKELPRDSVLCVMSTTACFAPRACDDIEGIALLCNKYDIPHLINNAYGLQSKVIMKRIQKAQNKGRVDAFVQSTDKNIMVPVGGAVIAAFNVGLLEQISKTYPGRASSSPVMDSFITLLHLGKNGYRDLIMKRDELYTYLKQELLAVSEKFGETLLNTPDNPISCAITLRTIEPEDLTQLGSMLFWRNISGTRVVTTLETKTIAGHTFNGLSTFGMQLGWF